MHQNSIGKPDDREIATKAQGGRCKITREEIIGYAYKK